MGHSFATMMADHDHEEEAPFDEVEERRQPRRTRAFATECSMRAIDASTVRILDTKKDEIQKSSRSSHRPWHHDCSSKDQHEPWMLCNWKCSESQPWGSRHPWDMDTMFSLNTPPALAAVAQQPPKAEQKQNTGENYYTQQWLLETTPPQPNGSHSTPHYLPTDFNQQPRTLGPPCLQLYRVRLPPVTLPLLSSLIKAAEAYATKLPTGWKTHLYSLTKQDIALQDIADHQPITDYVLATVPSLFGGRAVRRLDWNQPHILKYDCAGHRSVPLHHDLCDVTVNIALNDEFEGGGTFFPALGREPVRLERGEMLVHPGQLLHAGSAIRSGTRYLLIYFLMFA